MPVGPASGASRPGEPAVGREPAVGAVLDLTDRVRCLWTDASHGDLGFAAAADATASTSGVESGVSGRAVRPGVAGVAASMVGGSQLTWLRQVHGATVVRIGTGQSGELGEGDALVAPPASVGQAPGLCILTADCASIALAGDDGSYAAVHAGWRGLVAGVVDGAARALRSGGASRIVGALGPCIHAECYEFSPRDLDVLTASFGAAVRGRTASGRPALDLPSAVAIALADADIEQRRGIDACTSCHGGFFSHRARGDVGRQALVVWGVP
ncbi:MAG: polyphenol oxidase family protein [Actinomycetota bacterium]|nr:polyphenol oxidase family protein [Actinomycetota bacterium]